MGLFDILVLNASFPQGFFAALGGLESSGRLVGKKSTKSGTYKSSWSRVMTKKRKTSRQVSSRVLKLERNRILKERI